MELRRLAAADLNLLVKLAALLETASVTVAAQRLAITQPAMSRALGRLRELFDDPLLVRDGAGMRVTPRGRVLACELGPLVRGVDALLSPRGAFDPAQPHRFVLMMSDYAALFLLPTIVGHLAARAPSIDVDVRPLIDWSDTSAQLERGLIDAAVGFGHGAPSTLSVEPLKHERFVCAARHGHPRIRKRLTLRAYVDIAHVLVSSRGLVTGAVDVALKRHGERRRVGVVTPHLMSVPAILQTSDLIATVPSALRNTVGDALRWYSTPIEVDGFDLVIAHHPLQSRSTAGSWLREEISAALAP